MQLLLALGLLATGCAALVFFGTRWRDPRFGQVPVPEHRLRSAGTALTVTTWNIGFAGLGAEADFILDHGNNLRALDADQIKTASHAIAAHLAQDDADLILLQENAHAGFLTRNVPLRQTIEAALPERLSLWWTDMGTRYAPPFLRLDHGLSSHSNAQVTMAEAIELSPAPLTHNQCLKKYYGGLVIRIPIADSQRAWVVINLHLSAFDTDPQAKVAQLETLFDYAKQVHAKGDPVVIGGDWNMEITPTDFPHAPHLANSQWTYDFPVSTVPAGWQVVADHRTPTVRSMQRPYVRGETPTMVIDGFIVSPGVTVHSVNTQDLSFAHTDHHPVTARLSLS